MSPIRRRGVGVLTISRANPRDAEAVRAIASAGWRDTYAGLLQPETIEAFLAGPYSPESVARRIADHDVLLAVASDSPIAFADIVAEPDRILLVALYALPQLQRRGAGRALLAEIQGRATSKPVDAMVLVGNRKGEAFYERMGFKAFETVDADLFGERVTERRWRLNS